MNAPEEIPTFRDLRRRNKDQTRALREQNAQIREAEQRERQMRVQLASLPQPGLRAYVDVLRRRDDLSLSEALAVCTEAFTGNDDA